MYEHRQRLAQLLAQAQAHSVTFKAEAMLLDKRELQWGDNRFSLPVRVNAAKMATSRYGFLWDDGLIATSWINIQRHRQGYAVVVS